MSTLLLRLAGPLQSWGIDSKFEVRRTERLPSKSAVIGLLAAALGRGRGENLDDLNELRFGVREDASGEILHDFQIAKTNKDSYIIRRYYLQDAIFLVGLESEDDGWILSLEQALKHPVFHLFLGRKSCPPTLPFVLGVRNETLEEALKSEPWLLPEWRRSKASSLVRILYDCPRGESPDSIQRDLPVSFSSFRREYRSRGVKMNYVDMLPELTGEHDPVSELEAENVFDKSET